MTELEKYLAEVKARAEAATPGPWQRGGSGTVIADVGGDSAFDIIATEDVGLCKDFENTEFIMHARTDVDRLVAMVEAARAGLIAVAGPQRGEYVDRNAREALAELDRLAAGGTQ